MTDQDTDGAGADDTQAPRRGFPLKRVLLAGALAGAGLVYAATGGHLPGHVTPDQPVPSGSGVADGVTFQQDASGFHVDIDGKETGQLVEVDFTGPVGRVDSLDLPDEDGDGKSDGVQLRPIRASDNFQLGTLDVYTDASVAALRGHSGIDATSLPGGAAVAFSDDASFDTSDGAVRANFGGGVAYATIHQDADVVLTPTIDPSQPTAAPVSTGNIDKDVANCGDVQPGALSVTCTVDDDVKGLGGYTVTMQADINGEHGTITGVSVAGADLLPGTPGFEGVLADVTYSNGDTAGVTLARPGVPLPDDGTSERQSMDGGRTALFDGHPTVSVAGSGATADYGDGEVVTVSAP